jgi:hypothetical protein
VREGLGVVFGVREGLGDVAGVSEGLGVVFGVREGLGDVAGVSEGLGAGGNVDGLGEDPETREDAVVCAVRLFSLARARWSLADVGFTAVYTISLTSVCTD